MWGEVLDIVLRHVASLTPKRVTLQWLLQKNMLPSTHLHRGSLSLHLPEQTHSCEIQVTIRVLPHAVSLQLKTQAA